jgi:Zn-dependent peptidase ImmA (M78 family)
MKPAVIRQLRDFVPIRPLTRQEALRIAELQAIRFLVLSGVSQPPVPERIMTELPRVLVERFTPLPVSGAAEWSHGRWLVLINGAEPQTRQRFSVAHEFKHVLDHRFAAVLYENLPADERDDFIEHVCDYFAGSLLVPRTWLKNAWAGGLQGLPELAHRFAVSQAAMQVRLKQVGLSEPSSRCGSTSSRWFTRLRGQQRTRYHRRLSVTMT